MGVTDLKQLRAELEQINGELLRLFNRRGEIVLDVQGIKLEQDIPTYLPEREQEMLTDLIRDNPGPFDKETIRHLFSEIFRASVLLMEQRKEGLLKTSRQRHPDDLVIEVGDVGPIAPARIGASPVVIAGPCAVESEEQMEAVGELLARLGLRFLRGGAFKPRSSPYAFQGLGERGLEILHATAQRHGLVVVSEVMDPRMVEQAERYIDVLQIGARNMYNYDLLREVGRCEKPVLLKRGFSATLEELLWSAEYIVSAGNEQVILCERGIRTFEPQTRNTLDISAVPLLRQKSFLPVIVDVSHAAGRRDILPALARAALAAGANGLMVEVHPHPQLARSDNEQQLDLEQFVEFIEGCGLSDA